jgi:tryptophanyl-tRNA synthetase
MEDKKEKTKPVVLTGDRPTGGLHLGHYIGSIKNRIALQDQYDDVYYMVADIQALTDNAENPGQVSSNTFEVIKDNLACGVDPKKTKIFIQSQIPEIAELTVLFLNLVTLSRLKRNPTVKDEMKQKGFGEDVPAGFLVYPVSQAADILFVKSSIIPVGDDQIPVIEQANEIVEKFNRIYSPIFPKIKPLTSEITRLVGIDGKAKASKSLNNAILLSDDSKTIKEKVMKMYTDPNHTSVDKPGKIEGNVVFTYLDAFDQNKEKVSELKKQYKKGGLGDVELKNYLFEVLENLISPIRKKRAQITDDQVLNILKNSSKEVKKEAAKTMEEVRKVMKINYFKN